MTTYTELEQNVASALYFENEFFGPFLAGGRPHEIYRLFSDSAAQAAAASANSSARVAAPSSPSGLEQVFKLAQQFGPSLRVRPEGGAEQAANQLSLRQSFIVTTPWLIPNYQRGYETRQQLRLTLERTTPSEFLWTVRLPSELIPADRQDRLGLTLRELYRGSGGISPTVTPEGLRLRRPASKWELASDVSNASILLEIDTSASANAVVGEVGERTGPLRVRASVVATIARLFGYLSIIRVGVALSAALTYKEELSSTTTFGRLSLAAFERNLALAFAVPSQLRPLHLHDDRKDLVAVTNAAKGAAYLVDDLLMLAGLRESLSLDSDAQLNVTTIGARMQTGAFQIKQTEVRRIQAVQTFRRTILDMFALGSDGMGPVGGIDERVSLGRLTTFIENARKRLGEFLQRDKLLDIVPKEIIGALQTLAELINLTVEIAKIPLSIASVPSDMETAYGLARQVIDRFAPSLVQVYANQLAVELAMCGESNPRAQAVLDALRIDSRTADTYFSGAVVALLSQSSELSNTLLQGTDDASLVQDALGTLQECVETAEAPENESKPMDTPLWDQLGPWSRLFHTDDSSRSSVRGGVDPKSFVQQSIKIVPKVAEIIAAGLLSVQNVAKFLTERVRYLTWYAYKQNIEEDTSLMNDDDVKRYKLALDEIGADLSQIALDLFGTQFSVDIQSKETEPPDSRNDNLTRRAAARQSAGKLAALELKMKLGQYSSRPTDSETDGITAIESRQRFATIYIAVSRAKFFADELERYYATRGKKFIVNQEEFPDVDVVEATEEAALQRSINITRNRAIAEAIADTLKRAGDVVLDDSIDQQKLPRVLNLAELTNALTERLRTAAISRSEDSFARQQRNLVSGLRRIVQGEASRLGRDTKPPTEIEEFLLSEMLATQTLASATILAREEIELAALAGDDASTTTSIRSAILATERVVNENVARSVLALLKDANFGGDPVFVEYVKLLRDFLEDVDARRAPIAVGGVVRQFAREAYAEPEYDVVWQRVTQLANSITNYFDVHALPPTVPPASPLLITSKIAEVDVAKAISLFEQVVPAADADPENAQWPSMNEVAKTIATQAMTAYASLLRAKTGPVFVSEAFKTAFALDRYFTQLEALGTLVVNADQKAFVETLLRLQRLIVLQTTTLSTIELDLREYDLRWQADDVLADILRRRGNPVVSNDNDAMEDGGDNDGEGAVDMQTERKFRDLSIAPIGNDISFDDIAGDVSYQELLNRLAERTLEANIDNLPDNYTKAARSFLKRAQRFLQFEEMLINGEPISLADQESDYEELKRTYDTAAVILDLDVEFENRIATFFERTKGAVPPTISERSRLIADLRIIETSINDLFTRLELAWRGRVQRLKQLDVEGMRPFVLVYDQWSESARALREQVTRVISSFVTSDTRGTPLEEQKRGNLMGRNAELQKLADRAKRLQTDLDNALKAIRKTADTAIGNNNDLVRLRDQIDEINRLVGEVNAQGENVAERVRDMGSAVNNVSASFRTTQTIFKERSSQIQKFTSDFAKLELSVTDAVETLRNFGPRVDNVTALVNDNAPQLERYKQRVGALSAQIADVSRQSTEIDRITKQVRKTADSVDSVERAIDTLQSSTKERLRLATEKQEEVRSAADLLRDDQKRVREDIDEQRNDVEALRRSSVKLAAEASTITVSMRSAERTVEKTQRSLEATKVRVDNAETRVRDLDSRHTQLTKRADDLQTRWERLDAGDTITTTIDAIDQLAATLDASLAKARAQRITSSNVLDHIKQQRAAVEADNKTARADVSAMSQLLLATERAQSDIAVRLSGRSTVTPGAFRSVIEAVRALVRDARTAIKQGNEGVPLATPPTTVTIVNDFDQLRQLIAALSTTNDATTQNALLVDIQRSSTALRSTLQTVQNERESTETRRQVAEARALAATSERQADDAEVSADRIAQNKQRVQRSAKRARDDEEETKENSQKVRKLVEESDVAVSEATAAEQRVKEKVQIVKRKRAQIEIELSAARTELESATLTAAEIEDIRQRLIAIIEDTNATDAQTTSARQQLELLQRDFSEIDNNVDNLLDRLEDDALLNAFAKLSLSAMRDVGEEDRPANTKADVDEFIDFYLQRAAQIENADEFRQEFRVMRSAFKDSAVYQGRRDSDKRELDVYVQIVELAYYATMAGYAATDEQVVAMVSWAADEYGRAALNGVGSSLLLSWAQSLDFDTDETGRRAAFLDEYLYPTYTSEPTPKPFIDAQGDELLQPAFDGPEFFLRNLAKLVYFVNSSWVVPSASEDGDDDASTTPMSESQFSQLASRLLKSDHDDPRKGSWF